jgi:hypothetical protein
VAPSPAHDQLGERLASMPPSATVEATAAPGKRKRPRRRRRKGKAGVAAAPTAEGGD